ncbi:MAG: gliding motility-associated C-terminal domain-containing protein [Flavobacteriales bacterium]
MKTSTLNGMVRMQRTARHLFIGLLLLAACKASATHLVGGNLGYTYVGETSPGSGMYRYNVYVQFFMNCGPQSNFQTLYELLGQDYGTPITVGAYPQDNNNPNADKVLFQEVQLFLTDSLLIEPDLPDGCTVGEGLCTVSGNFLGTVDLPLNFAGYHLYFQLCCRNLDILNLNNPNATGIGYYAFVPPPLVVNSSPIWLGIPTPFLCINDTSTFVNSATDPDGDQLIFSFEIPYDRVDAQGGLTPPPPILPWTIPECNYAAGFSLTQPFGAGGYSFINGATGLTQYSPTLQGNYIVSVEVKEYRNGLLIGLTRRDLQLQAIVCPPNNTPSVSGNLNLSYSVAAGDNLCFDMDFIDIDGDSLFLNAAGSIFDPLLFNPPATINAPDSGLATIGATFCWDTECDQGQQQPYLFSVSVSDNGCPPKNVDVVFQVTVVPFAGPTTITGPATVCTQATGIAYSTSNIANAVYTWSVGGGTIATQNGNAITVNWGAPGTGSVTVFATDTLGCASAPITIPVMINSIPAADAGPDQLICTATSVQIGGAPTGPPGSTFNWSPSGTLSDGTVSNPTATPLGSAAYIVTVSNAGCSGTDTVLVNISNIAVSAGPDAAICNGDTAQLQATGGDSYVWAPPATLSDASIPDPLAFPTSSTVYTLIITDSIGCVSTDSVLVNVNTLPSVDAGPDTSICENFSVAIGGAPTGPNGSTYEWSQSGTLDSDSLANPIATPTQTTTYTVTVTDQNSCVGVDSILVTLLNQPAVNAGPDLSICPGDSTQLQGVAGPNATWAPIAGLSDPNSLTPMASPATTTVYVLQRTANNGCSNSDSTTVTVFPATPADAGQAASVCLGDTAQLNATGGTAYTWSPGATLSDPNIQNPLAFPTITTTYTVQVTDANSCSGVDSVVVSIAAPVSAGTDGSATICSDQATTVPLFPLLGGSPTPGGAWFDDNGVPASDTYDPALNPSGTYVFDYVVGNVQCGNDTASVSITENQLPNAGANDSVTVCSNDLPFDLPLSTGVDSTGTWTGPFGQSSNGTYIPGTSEQGGYYYVLNGTAPCPNDTAFIQVTEVLALNAGSNSSVVSCGSGVAFNMLDSLQGGPDQSGSWTDPNNQPHGSIFDPSVDIDGTYTYTVAGGTACEASSTLQVSVQVPPANAGADDALCIGDTLQLSASGGTIFSWAPAADLSDAAIANPLAFPTSTDTFTVTVTDGLGCIASDDVIITVNALPVADAGPDEEVCSGSSVNIGGAPTGPGGSTYIWSPSTDLNSGTAANPDADPTATITYTVQVTDGNTCVNIDSMVVTVNPLPAVFAGNDTSFCVGGSVQLNAQGTGTFAWAPATGLNDPDIQNPIASPTSTTTYTVTITDGNGCENTDDINVAIDPIPTVDAGPDLWVCPGFGEPLQGSGSGTFSWSPGADLTDPNSATPIADPPTSTVYTLTVTSGNGCTANDAMTLTVNDDPPVDAGVDQTICIGEQVVLGGNPTGIAGSTFLWDPSTTLNDATLANPSASPIVTTTYTVVVTNDTCTSSDQVNVLIQGVADAAFNVRFEPGCDGLRAYFNDLSTAPLTWLWDFGNGATSTEQNPEFNLTYGQDFNVTLTITDIFGCTDATTQSYNVNNYEDYVQLDVPNVFTPNNDGMNDVFTINTDAILGPCTKMLVYNRWGQKEFESFGANISWDGRNFGGQECITGTYFYVIDVKGMSFEGTVLLNR